MTKKREYIELLLKTGDLIRRIRWKDHFFLLDRMFLVSNISDPYVFKSLKTAPLIKRLHFFETDLTKHYKWQHKNMNLFQTHLDCIVKDINESNQIFVK